MNILVGIQKIVLMMVLKKQLTGIKDFLDT
jgi:hypothetical protein